MKFVLKIAVILHKKAKTYKHILTEVQMPLFFEQDFKQDGFAVKMQTGHMVTVRFESTF